MVPIKNDKNTEIIKDIILQTFHFLTNDFHYIPSYNTKGSKIFLTTFEITFVNEINRRKVIISYTKDNLSGEIKHTFNASIIRLPYLTVEDYFGLFVFLQSIGKEFNTSFIGTFNENESNKILIKIADSFKKYTINILAGKLWLENFYRRKD